MNFQDVVQQEGRKFVLLGTGATTPVLLFSGKNRKTLIAEQNFQAAPRVKICMAIVELHCLIKLLPNRKACEYFNFLLLFSNETCFR